jgi:hypothetical protein
MNGKGLDDADGIATPGGCAGAGGAGGVAGVALVVLLALALWVWDSWRGSKPSSPDGAQPAALNWKDARLDLDYVVSETGRDLGRPAIRFR